MQNRLSFLFSSCMLPAPSSFPGPCHCCHRGHLHAGKTLGRIRPRHDGTQVSVLLVAVPSCWVLLQAFSSTMNWHSQGLCFGTVVEIVGIMSAGKALCPSC